MYLSARSFVAFYNLNKITLGELFLHLASRIPKGSGEEEFFEWTFSNVDEVMGDGFLGTYDAKSLSWQFVRWFTRTQWEGPLFNILFPEKKWMHNPRFSVTGLGPNEKTVMLESATEPSFLIQDPVTKTIRYPHGCTIEASTGLVRPNKPS